MSSDSDLANLFFTGFVQAFREQCETSEVRCRYPDKSSWTEFMLDKEHGFAARYAKNWAEETLKRACIARSEWHKFDLMILSSSGTSDWWRSVPLITLEHENDNGIQDEVWKLACWKSKLKVLMTYHDDDAQESAKREVASGIISSIAEDHSDDGAAWLLISAPRTWGNVLDWTGHKWTGREWSKLALI